MLGSTFQMSAALDYIPYAFSASYCQIRQFIVQLFYELTASALGTYGAGLPDSSPDCFGCQVCAAAKTGEVVNILVGAWCGAIPSVRDPG